MTSIFTENVAKAVCYSLAGVAFGLGLVGFLIAPANSVELKWTVILAGAYVSYNFWALGANRRMYIWAISLAPATDRVGRAIPFGLLWIFYIVFWVKYLWMR